MTYLRAVLIAALACAGGCYGPDFSEGVACGPDGECPTGQDCIAGVCRTPSKLPDAGDEESCPNENALLFVPSNIDVCDIDEDPPNLALTSATTPLDTDDATLGGQPVGTVITQSDGSEALLVSARSFSLGEDNFLDVSGSRPLILVSLADIEIDGLVLAPGNLDVSGAGASPVVCSDESGAGAAGIVNNSGFSGGGGGGFAFVGGIGGAAVAGDTEVAGGAVNGGNELAPLRGGCPGGVGGGPRGGAGGGGGGAIQLIAAGTVRVGPEGVISVAGGGGGGGGTAGDSGDAVAGDGGGGGGSGGAILIEAGLGIVLEADEDNGFESVLTAAGGGGGSGAVDGSNGNNGNNGGTEGPGAGGGAQMVSSNSSGGGGPGGGSAGSDAGEPGGNGVIAGAIVPIGGGGGGGAAGRIVLRSDSVTTDGATFPLPTLQGF